MKNRTQIFTWLLAIISTIVFAQEAPKPAASDASEMAKKLANLVAPDCTKADFGVRTGLTLVFPK